jgi:hypothetical protein
MTEEALLRIMGFLLVVAMIAMAITFIVACVASVAIIVWGALSGFTEMLR